MTEPMGPSLVDARAEFAQLIHQHQGIVLKVAHGYSRHRQDRADLVQDILLQLWRAFADYDRQRRFSTWAYRIALNVAISHLRHDVPRRQLADPMDEQLQHLSDDNSRDAETEHQLQRLQQCIQQLEPMERALMLLYLDGHSYREIGDILGISEINVATRIHRLKQRLRADF
ncbi:RNA polymerase sigma factor [Pseudoxanthomonas dokdonensis]|nr:sigma-70 family RNA polymerase sigma factor [Pseudoxanthomonas dokdonensis]